MIERTNIEAKLRKQRSRSRNSDSVDKLLSDLLAEARAEHRIETTLSSGVNDYTNDFDIDLLESDKVYHIDTIKKICIDYRLRFLDSRYFKNEFPEEAITKIKDLEAEHNIELSGFKVMAPSKLFRLENPDDPLLFAPIGNGYYYLIHKWGNDLNAFRKWLVLPFKSLDNLMFFAFLASVVITYLYSLTMDTNEHFLTNVGLLFLFMFKSVIAVMIFYAVPRGKNVNEAIWDSKYTK
ncbi:MAG: hypothetical protein AAF688_08650 [Bacteroidota bacterium]